MQQIYKCNIFGTRIDNLSKKEILDKVNYFLCQNNQFNRISTLNPEILLQTRNNLKLQKAINSSELNIADGIGIKFAFLRYGKILKARYSGIDLVWDILHIANEQKINIYLVANKDGLSTWQGTRDAILEVYPNLQIDGLNINISNYDLPVIDCQLLITNLGAPHQELFLQSIKDAQSSSLQLGIGVGGAFDYISHKVPRAPQWMRNCGFEWLFRLIKQPNRIKRIFNAVIIFPLYVIFTKNT
ncbi:MAG: WecB/TagA/CpsF family glycosyltransferase [Patescibacteria group bacterium]|nr:WecB/TagA/CpsF family glycosyltransferase [Patescibacteria group bacterium]